jgi:hypothetical protein
MLHIPASMNCSFFFDTPEFNALQKVKCISILPAKYNYPQKEGFIE